MMYMYNTLVSSFKHTQRREVSPSPSSHCGSARGTKWWSHSESVHPLVAHPPSIVQLHTASDQKLDSGKAWEQSVLSGNKY